MRIVSLESENIKKIKAVQITPDPAKNLVVITGDNGAGKSSVLDSIMIALAGAKYIPDEPIRNGEDNARSCVDIGDYIVTRTITGTKPYIKVETKEGLPVKSPQGILDDIVGGIAFDPLEFLKRDPKKQRETLLQVLNLEADVAKFDAQEEALRTERTLVGRDRDKAKALFDQLPVFPEVLGLEERSFEAAQKVLTDAQDVNHQIDLLTQQNEGVRQSGKQDEEHIAIMNRQIADITKERDETQLAVNAKKAQFLATRTKLAGMTMIDTSAMQAEISALELVNGKIRDNIRREDASKEWKKAAADYDAKSAAIDKISGDRLSLMANAPMPVPGLAISEDGLTYNGNPVKQASDGEKLMIGVGICMALNPKLRVILIRDGSLLGPKNMALLESMIADKDYQLWFEKVGDGSDGVGILIEDGSVVSVDGKPVESAAPASERPATKRRGRPKKGAADNPTDDFGPDPTTEAPRHPQTEGPADDWNVANDPPATPPPDSFDDVPATTTTAGTTAPDDEEGW